MDDSSPSMRITRGMPLHANVVENLSLFSMGLTQDFGVNVGFMTKSKQVQDEQSFEELRSKKKNDPMAIQKVINNTKANGIKIIEGGSKQKAINSDSEQSGSAS
ncbi:hypothetical protein H5410_037178 [Solanum commersonii]|uniref:Uncharacterized protein n=1 Tax=Solanum commersonii TaxID=4109 RepID=A0A9J5Y7A3_SOLCO|nr:hypothetical protein H5410_037178 [Solanum commersonii]